MALKTTGYQAAVATISWTSGQALDSLQDNEWTDLSDEINNETNEYVFVDVEAILASAAFTGSDSVLEVYLVPSIDGGANYPDWTGNVTSDQQQNDQYFVDSVTTSGTTAAQRLSARNILVAPGRYKWGFRNKTGVSTGATGNSARWRPHSFKDA